MLYLVSVRISERVGLINPGTAKRYSELPPLRRRELEAMANAVVNRRTEEIFEKVYDAAGFLDQNTGRDGMSALGVMRQVGQMMALPTQEKVL
jgi:hypothetical protein